MSWLLFGTEEEIALGTEALGADTAAALERGGPMTMEGMTGAIGWIDGLVARLKAPEALLHGAFDLLEAAERNQFAMLGGRFQATGASIDSLTVRDDPEAVREIKGMELVFGSAVPYAVFETNVIEGGKHYGGSAILVDANNVLGLDENVLTAATGEPPTGGVA